MSRLNYDDGDALPWGPIRQDQSGRGEPFRGTGMMKLGFAQTLEIYEIDPRMVADGLRHVLRRMREKGWIGGRGRRVSQHLDQLTISQAIGNVYRVEGAPFNLHIVARAALEEIAGMDMWDWNEVRNRTFDQVAALFLRAIYFAQHFHDEPSRSARA